MNEEDLKQCYRMFAMLGYLMNGDYHPHEIPALAKAMADAMIEEPKQKEKDDEEDVGISAIKPKRVYRRKS